MTSRNTLTASIFLAAFFAVSASSLLSCGGSVVGAPCEDDRAHCEDGCVDLRSDERNCGDCGKACAQGQTCWDGDCLDCDDEPGTVLCSGECVNIETDTNNCGLCGNACDVGVPCRNGRCEACPDGLFSCEDECVDILFDEDNCGSCGNACLDDEECRDGQCWPPCEPPRVLCGNECVDLSSSTGHCGECDNECQGATPSCVSGHCQEECPDWMEECDGDCIDIYYDPNNCGACDVVCPGSSPVCVAGSCIEGCEPPLEECKRQCVDTQSNPSHCGGCDEACAPDLVCAEGECQVDCGELTECAGQCVNTDTSPAHCGGCGQACASGRACIAGECVLFCDGGLAKCDDACVDLYTDRDHCGECFNTCDDGDLCVGAECIPDCGSLTWCGFDEGCVDLQSSNDNCQSCGNECEDDWFCVVGVCELQCPDPLLACNAECVSTDDDPRNCGGCNTTCESGICDFGDCREQAAGHLVAFGHDFTESHAVLRLLLGNAVFISQESPVKVLGFSQYADGDQVTRIDTAISSIATAKGRSWQKSDTADPQFVVDNIFNYDVLLVYTQNAPQASDLRTLGASWTSALESFFGVGGIVVFIDSKASAVGTYEIFDAAGVFSCSGLVAANNKTAQVLEPGDAVAQGVTTSYLGSPNSATFSTEEGVVVTVDKATQRPFIVHKTFIP